MSEYLSDHFEYSVEGSHPQLGSPLGQLRGSWSRNSNMLGASIFLGLISALITIGTLSNIAWNEVLAGNVDQETAGALTAFLLFGLLTLGCAVPGFWAIEGSTTVITLYSRGFTKETFITSREVLWDEIVSVHENHSQLYRHGELMSTHHALRLRLASGRKVALELSHINGSESVAALITEHTLSRLTAAAMNRLESEGRVRFGPLTVTKDELQFERLLWTSRIAWSQIKKVEVENGHLIIRMGDEWLGNWCHYGVAGIPDFRILLVLLEQLTNGPMGGSQFAQVSDRFRETGSMLAAWPGER